MRFRAQSAGGEVVAVTGINTVSFAFLTTKATNKDLLGFAVERADPTEDEKYFMAGYKVFQSAMPTPPPNVAVSTYDQPVARDIAGLNSLAERVGVQANRYNDHHMALVGR